MCGLLHGGCERLQTLLMQLQSGSGGMSSLAKQYAEKVDKMEARIKKVRRLFGTMFTQNHPL